MFHSLTKRERQHRGEMSLCIVFRYYRRWQQHYWNNWSSCHNNNQTNNLLYSWRTLQPVKSARATSAMRSLSSFSYLWCSERADPLLLNLIRFSSFQKTVFISHMWLMAILLTETELWMHDTLTDVTLLNHFFSILHEEHKNTAAITHTAAQLEQECELMSRSGQVNEGWRWSAEGWN